VRPEVGTCFLKLPHNIRPFAVVSVFRSLFFMVVFMCVSAGSLSFGTLVGILRILAIIMIIFFPGQKT